MSENSNSALNQCLRAVWRRTQRKHLVGGLLAFARWFIPLFVAVLMVDRFAYLPGWVRGIVTLVLLVVSARQAWRHGWSRFRSFDPSTTAKEVEVAKGGMNSLLVTAVQFQQQGASAGTSASMWEQALSSAEVAAKEIPAEKVVSFAALKRPLQIGGGLVVLLILMAVLKGPFLAAGFGRLFTPWQAIAYPTKTKIELGEGELVLKEGSAGAVEIRLSGELPDTAKLALQTGEGRPREIELEVVDGLCSYEIASASRGFSYRVKAGDARSEWRQVRVIPAPRLSEVAVNLEYPAYIDRAAETVEALTLTVPEETQVKWSLTLDTPIREAMLHRDGVDDVPLEIGEDGRTLVLAETAAASRGYSFSWVEADHGFEFTSPRYFLQVASDQAPRIELTAPQANLNAMLGRPLELAVRAQDDHGIGATTITYRVNRRPEKVVALSTPVQSGAGEQTLDWDYREELSDLQIGDTVSFVVEVSDKYPGEAGPNRARTESRRITFLSREEYLAAITKQMERLLTRVRTLYRQERAAHELVSSLDPEADSYLPTCQLEAIRQEMVREQLVATADEVQALLDDLAANQVSDAVESDMLSALQSDLRLIAKEDVLNAADLLRSQVGAEVRDPLPAIGAVNKAARELAELVMQRGIDASREVFARETHMLARELAGLRLRLITAGADDAEALASAHEDVAAWTVDLLDQLTKHMSYEKKALHVLGLNRRIHSLRTGGLTESLKDVAKLARGGEFAKAATTQYPLIRPLLESEFTMRSGSQFAQMRDLREQVAIVQVGQKELIEKGKKLEDFEQLAQHQSELRDQLVLATLPSIPAPRATIFDLELMPVPPTDERRLAAEAAMDQAIEKLEAGSKDEAAKSQMEALDALQKFSNILEVWSVELAQMSLGVSASVSDATDRLGVCEQFEARQVALLVQTEEAALDENNPPALLEDQQGLLEEVQDFRKEIAGVEGDAPKNLLPLIGRLDAVAKAMEESVGVLKEGKPEEALEPQEMAADALAEARTLAEQQLIQFNLLNGLIGFQQSVEKATVGMADLVGGQNDLIAATLEADEDGLEALLKPQDNLLTCLTDIAPSLDLVASRMDVGTPLVFAASDVEDALLAMEDGDGEDAAEIQEIAVESLSKVEGLVGEIAVQTGYVSEIIEFLHDAQTDAAYMAFRQRTLRETRPDDLLALQEALAAEAQAYGRVLAEVAGNVDFEKLDEKAKLQFEGLDLSMNFQSPASSMNEAVAMLKGGQDATESMTAAENALRNNSHQMTVIIEMLSGLPALELNNASPPELFRLIDVLDVAAKERQLLRETASFAGQELPKLSARQAKVADKLGQFSGGENADAALAAVHATMQPIAAALKGARKADAGSGQKAVDLELRHYIVQWALILNTLIPPPSSSDSDVLTESETDDLYQTDTAGFVSDFVSGEGPKDKESEWEILGERNRAALNQNFARELPLEYRATLKNYYERVAK